MKSINGWAPLGTLFLGLAFTVASCNQPTEAPASDKANSEIKTTTTNEEESGLHNKKVRRSTYMLWKAGYEFFTTHRKHPEGQGYLDSSYVELKLTNNHVTQLAELCPECPGMRVYFGAVLSENNTYKPQLLYVPVTTEGNDTNVDTGGTTIGRSAYNLEEEVFIFDFINLGTAQEYINTWNTFNSTRNSHNPAYFPIKAYTFNMSELQSLAGTGDLYAVFGYTPVGSDPAYANAYAPESNCGEYDQGGMNAIKIAFSSLSADVSMGKIDCDFLDFANPCPQYCGNGLFD